MKTNLLYVGSLLILLGACAISPPERAPYGGTDNVAAVSADSLTGTWNIRILNPIEGEETTTASITLNADGSASGASQSTIEGQTFAVSMTGTWSIDGEYLMTTSEKIGDESDSSIMQLATSLASSLAKNRKTRGDVFELSANRVVIVDSETGQAQEWTR